MRKFKVVIKFDPRNNEGFVILGNRVAAALLGNVSFATPAVTLLVLQSAIDAVVAAIAAWGPVGNRGSHAALLDLMNKTSQLSVLLRAEADYIQTTAALAANGD